MPQALQRYALCRQCAERQCLGLGLFELVNGDDCFICEGIMSRVQRLARKAVIAVRGYDFETFAVGIAVPADVQEREDELRSMMKLRGRETLKVHLSRLITEQLASSLKKKPDKERPELVAVINIENESVDVTSSPLFYYVRYTKPEGVSQRRELCQSCRGKGCAECEFSGYSGGPTVEEPLRRRLERVTGCRDVRITWLGSEDVDSRVYPPGRPVLVELKNPRRRSLPRSFLVRQRGGLIRFAKGRILPGRPASLPGFKFRTRIYAEGAELDVKRLRLLPRVFRNTDVTFRRPNGRPVKKRVYMARGVLKEGQLVIDAELDGGLPVKRFVMGDLVSPSISEVLKTEVRCRKFDILRVIEKGEFVFA